MCRASPTKRLVLVTTHTSQRRSTVSDIAYAPTPLGELKAKQQQIWSSGDYGKIAWITVPLATELCSVIDPRPGSSVLDVACGTGHVAIEAARRFCQVAGSDYVPSSSRPPADVRPPRAFRSTSASPTPRSCPTTTTPSTMSCPPSASCSPPTTPVPRPSWSACADRVAASVSPAGPRRGSSVACSRRWGHTCLHPGSTAAHPLGVGTGRGRAAGPVRPRRVLVHGCDETPVSLS